MFDGTDATDLFMLFLVTDRLILQIKYRADYEIISYDWYLPIKALKYQYIEQIIQYSEIPNYL